MYWTQRKYCDFCGKELGEIKVKARNKFDPFTGEAYWFYQLQCPSYLQRNKTSWENHYSQANYLEPDFDFDNPPWKFKQVDQDGSPLPPPDRD